MTTPSVSFLAAALNKAVQTAVDAADEQGPPVPPPSTDAPRISVLLGYSAPRVGVTNSSVVVSPALPSVLDKPALNAEQQKQMKDDAKAQSSHLSPDASVSKENLLNAGASKSIVGEKS
jgi:hypothetical protein